MNLILLFDVFLIAALLLVSWRLLGASDLFQATVLFISFGLFLSLAWIRLGAPDIALAEAAVGAGLAGVLLFGTFKGLEPGADRENDSFTSEPCRLDPISPCPGKIHLLLAFTCVGSLTTLLVLAVLDLPATGDGLTPMVSQFLERSGVEHPVTAVLLNFRFYDTWLELGVLVAAVLGILCVRNRFDLRELKVLQAPDVMLRRLVMGLAPTMALVVVYLLWLGDHAPGGAFQAGVVLAAMLVLLWFSGHASITGLSRMLWLFCLIAGFAVMLLVAVVSALWPEMRPLEFPEEWSAMIILGVEVVATLSIGVALSSLAILSLGAVDDPGGS